MSSQNTSTQRPPDYLATLRLERAPFLDQPDDQFFYADPMLLQRLDLLQHLSRFGDMLIGVIGPEGAGKTTLLQQFLRRGGNGWRLCRLEGARITLATELFGGLAECFGLPLDPDADRIKANLLRHGQGLQQGGQLAVAVVDDAQRLPEAVLRALLTLGGSPGETLKTIRIVLFGDDTLEQRLTDIGLHSPQQPLLHRLDIPRLDEQQSAAYLMYRLAVAGHSGDCPFSLTEIRAMHKAADGRPGRLNVLAHEALIGHAERIATRNRTGSAAPRRPSPGRPVWGVAGLGVLALAGAAYLLMNAGRENAPSTTTTEPALALRLPPEALPPIDPGPPPDDDVTAEADVLPTPPAEPTQQPDAGTVTPPSPATEPQPVPGPELAPPPEAVLPPEAASPSDPPIPTPATPATPPPPAETTAGPIPVPATTERPSEQPAAAAVPSAPETPADAPVRSVAPTLSATAATSAPTELLREEWLSARPGTRFTLQLLGVRTETALQNYAAQQALPPPVAYFRTEYKGGDWYVLVQGDYASLDAARAAIGGLPMAVRKAKPWPRSFASVHADLKKP